MVYIITPIIMDQVAALLLTILNLFILTVIWYTFWVGMSRAFEKLRYWFVRGKQEWNW